MGEGLGEGLGDLDGSGLSGKSAAGAAVQAAATTTSKASPKRLFPTISLAIDAPALGCPDMIGGGPSKVKSPLVQSHVGRLRPDDILGRGAPGSGGAGDAPIV
jgi:hypothetical protein